MKYDINFTETAEADLRNIALYITETSKEINIAIDFVNELQEQCNRLSDFPSIGAYPKDFVLKSLGYRFLVHKEYLIFYTIEEAEKSVYIQAIFHGKKDYNRVFRII